MITTIKQYYVAVISQNKGGTVKRLASLLAILLTFMTVNPSLANASAPDRELLHNGHADVAHVEWDQASGRPTIKILWNESELKEAKDVYIRLGPDADATGRETSRLRVPDDPRFGFLGKPGDIVWTAPQKESDKWAPVAAAFGAGHSFPDELMDRIKPETLHLDLVDVDGPGEFNAFTVNPLGVSHLFSSTGTDHRRQVVHPGSHTHTSWAFSQPGRYNLTWQAAVETRDGKTIESDPTVVSWLVGTDEQVGLDKGSTQPAHEITTPAEQFPIAKGQDTGSDDPLAFNPTANMAGCLHHASGPVTLKAEWQADWKSDNPQKPARPKMSITSGDSGKQIDGEVGVINVPDSLKAAAPQAGADEFNGIFAAGTQFHRIPASAQNGQPSQVLDTTGTDFANLHEADITWDPIEGPQDGKVSVVDTTNGQTKTVLSSSESSLRTVMRVNKAEKTPMEMWFSKPGFYRISGYYTIHGKPDANGRKQHRYVPFTMQYAVGDAAVANACQGKGEVLNGSSNPDQGKPADPQPSPEPSKPADPPPTSDPTPKSDPVPDNSHTDGNNVVLDRGHLDAFRVGSSADGGIDLKLKEDVTGEGVLREPENVLLKVRDSALTDIPSGLPGAPKGYVLPLTQKSGLLWPGWETFDVKRNGFSEVKINVRDVKGPGTVNLFSQGTLGDVRSLLDGDSTTLPGTITVKQPTHEHANWVFSKPGVYTMTVQASAEKDGNAFQSKLHTYTWVVGDKTELPDPWGTGAPADTAKPSPSPTDGTRPSPAPTTRPSQNSAPEPSTEPTAKLDSDKKPGTDGKSNGGAKPGADKQPADKKNPCSKKLVLDHGHSDVFRVGSADKNGLNLKIKEDVTGEGVLHTPEDVLLAVKDSALMSIPKGYPGAPKGYVLPITQNPDLLWPGWETFDVKRNGFSEVKINVRDVKGPGKVHLFTQNSFAGTKALLDGGSTALPGTITVKEPSHVHANWVFTKPGRYEMTVDATSVRYGKTVKTATHTYTWAVGSKAIAEAKSCTAASDKAATPAADQSAGDTGGAALGGLNTVGASLDGAPEASGDGAAADGETANGSQDAAEAASGAAAAAKKEVCRPVKIATKKASPASSDGAKKSATPAAKAAAPAGQAASIATEGHFDWGVQLESGKLISALKDDRSAPAKWVNPSSIVMSVGDKANTTAPGGMEFIAKSGTKVWLIGATQVPGVPWLGVNTMHPSIVNGTTGPVQMHLDKVDGPGKMAVFMSGTFGGGVGQRVFDNVGGPTSYTVAANTHAHPNWVFTKPGHYAVTVTQTATTKAGKKVSATGTLHFAVGTDAKAVASSVAATPTSADAAPSSDSGKAGDTAQNGDAAQGDSPAYTVVGRTPDGKPCDLNGLPGTGADGQVREATTAARPTKALGCGVALGGFGLLLGASVVARRRHG